MSAISSKDILVNATIKGTAWVYLSTYSAKLMVFISMTVLARLLTKEDFGVAGYALLSMSFIEIMQGLGIRQALVYHNKEKERTNTAFWLGLGVSLVLLMFALLIAAPIAGWWFNDPRAVYVTRVLALSLPISSLGLVHNALLRKRLAFKRQFIPEFSRAFSKGLTSIGLALLGWGVWSLIIGQLTGVFISVIMLWTVVKWRPTLNFCRTHVRPLLTYGSHIVYNNALSTLLANLDYLLIGHYMGAAALGVYTLAFRIPQLIIMQFSGIIGKVIFPVYVTMRDDKKSLNRGFILTLQYVNLVTVPAGLGLALISKPVVLVFFGEKWIEAIPVMTAIALYTLLRAIVFNIGNIYKALGKPDLLAKIKLWQTIIFVPAIWWVAAEIGTTLAVAWVQVALAFLATIVKLIIAANILDTAYKTILTSLRPTILAGALMAIAVLTTLRPAANLPPLVQMIASITVGGLIYGAAIWWLQRPLIIQAGTSLRTALNRK